MNQDTVSTIARRHKQLESVHTVSDDAALERARQQAEAEEADALWTRLGRECQEFCDYYNAAIGNARVFCEVHGDTIVVRSHQDAQNTVAFSRNPGAFHGGSLAAHHYHYPIRASDLPVGVRRADGGLTLTYEGEDVSPEDLVLTLLSSYTDELVTPRS